MRGSYIKILAFIEAASVTGPAKNLLDFAKRARDGGDGCSPATSVEIELVTFNRLRRTALLRPNSGGLDRGDSQHQSNPFVRRARALGIQVHVISEGFSFDPRVVAKLRDLVERVGPDIIQTHHVKSHFLLRASGMARRYPWVAFHHGYTATDAKMRVYNQLDRWSLRAARRIVTVSTEYARQIEALDIAGARIRVVRNAIDPESFRDQTPEQVKSLRKRLNLTVGSRVVLNVGRLSAEKGHIYLVQAFATLCRDRPEYDARLVVVGDGPQRPLLVRTAESLGLGERLILAGQVSDPRPYYLAADTVVLPSVAEGSPNVLLEAMTAGVPIVATRIGGVTEMITHGVSGLLVEARDCGSLASAMHDVLSDPDASRKLAQNAKAVAAASFAPAARVRALVNLYQEVGARTCPA